MRGIADGYRMKAYKDIRRLNMFPELTQAACTVLGAWGPATTDQKLIHLRGLDWD